MDEKMTKKKIGKEIQLYNLIDKNLLLMNDGVFLSVSFLPNYFIVLQCPVEFFFLFAHNS